MKQILIIGTGGLARELTEWCRDHFEIIGYFSTNDLEHRKYQLPGMAYSNPVTPMDVGTENALIAIGSTSVKEKIYFELLSLGFKFPNFIHPSSTVSNSAVLADGSIIAPNCTIGPNAKIGLCSYVNFSVGIGHDAEISDFVQINPGSQIGGFCKIGAKTLIGSGTTILHGTSVGQSSTIGSGSVCFTNIKSSATVMGNPAKRIRLFEKSN